MQPASWIRRGLLIRAGADIEGKANPIGWYSPLQLAVHDRKLEMMRLLVSLGASLSQESLGAGDALLYMLDESTGDFVPVVRN